MLPRRKIAPEGHWKLGFQVNNSQGVRGGPFVFVAGQVDLDAGGAMVHPGDLAAQAKSAMAHVETVLAGGGADADDLVKLTVFYVSDGGVDEAGLLDHLAACLGRLRGPGPAITLVPLPGLAYPGMEIEIEALAMREPNGGRLPRAAAWDPDCPRLPPLFSQALRCGELLVSSGITALDGAGALAAPGDLAAQSRLVLPKVDRLFRQLGADLWDAVKTNVFNVEPGTQADWAAPALIRAAHYREPGPAATGISLPRLWPEGAMVVNDVIAMRGTDGERLARRHAWPSGHWDWPVHLPYRHGVRCGDLAFLGGQVALTPDAQVRHPGDMIAQSTLAMNYIGRVLGELGLDFDNVVKINAFYAGDVGEETLRRNAEVRFSYFRGEPGPASTGVPVPYLAYEDMVIEIDLIAMV
jgi:enamine deaminase RidA (YjgF/YER057c/UK114 family)